MLSLKRYTTNFLDRTLESSKSMPLIREGCNKENRSRQRTREEPKIWVANYLRLVAAFTGEVLAKYSLFRGVEAMIVRIPS